MNRSPLPLRNRCTAWLLAAFAAVMLVGYILRRWWIA